MRFRTTIDNVPTFFRIIQSIEKLQKKCIIKFTETNMHLICNSDTNEGGIQVWSQIKVESIFSGYRIQSNASNEITVALFSEALLAALRSASSSTTGALSSFEAEEVVMKLAKKSDQAVLSFEITGMTRVGRRVKVTHDVKIEVMKPSDVERLNEPMCPEPDTHILLPPLQKLRTIVDRLRPMSNVLGVRANNNGCLQFSIHTESVKVDTEWKGCTNPKMARENASQQEDPPSDPDEMFSVLVSIRSFIKFLHSHVVSTTTIACICQNHCMILYVYIGDVADAGGVLTFYIPAMLDDDG
ncbi:cell cycle checkpoint [Guyanagaster necrorhizus]|uniref:Checkpoint protein n=1 Tax=Guyanagaster necrorhizus TaxID=856835 RepID=A0A9P7W4I3_9AGAR|nr:cell cycle checkpoint [Guyanagaster necrorhizus MCA 3950]KAG7452492.1 cell cycle checkpoint [Guyanagaster necrorhizus MCA 3950]